MHFAQFAEAIGRIGEMIIHVYGSYDEYRFRQACV